MANPQVVVDFIANTSGLNRGFSEAGQGAQGFGSKIKGIGRAAVIAGGAAGLAALTGTLKVGVDELTQAAKVAAQTEAVIKSTGGAAGVSAKQVSELAQSMMEKTGIDDEAIQSGENLLLTFTNIKNAAGKNNDIFNQSTKIMADMSVALGQDMKTSAIQLGKALNNPVKGITALQRVGVSFTDAQKKQIKQMQESGDVMGAQKLILAELRKEFGGSAEAAGKTLPGQLNILKESFANLAGVLVSTLAPALSAITKFLVENPALAKALIIGVLALSAAFVTLNVALAISTALASPWILIAVGIAAAVAGLIVIIVLLAKNWDKVVGVMDAGFDAIKKAASAVFGWLKSNWPLLLGILTGPVGTAVVLLIRNWDTVKQVTQAAWGAVRNAVGSAVDFVKGVVQSLADKVSDVVATIKRVLGGLDDWITGFARGALTGALNVARGIFSKISDGAEDALNAVKRAMNNVVQSIESIIGRVRNAASDVANAIKAPINAVIHAWNSLSFTIPSIKIPSIKIGKKKIGGGSIGGSTINFPNISPLAAGGVIDSPTLALVGEAGREIVTPEKLLRDIVGERSVEVRVFIGETELTDIVRTEIVDSNSAIARTLLAGGAA